MTAPSIDVKRCLGVIKQLQAKNEQIIREKDEALEDVNHAKQELHILQDKYDDLIMRYSNMLEVANTTSEGQCIPIEDDAAEEDLTCPKETSQAARTIKVDENYVKNLEDLLQDKEREIQALQQANQNLTQVNIQVSKIKCFLQETKSISKSYIAQLEKAQSYLDSPNLECCQETTLSQEVSGDQDTTLIPNSEPQSSLQKELDRVKAENQALMSHKQNMDAELASIVAEKSEIEEENKRLQTQISILSTAKTDFPMQSQIKVFLDDFQDERKEKEQQYKEKREVYEENRKLADENRGLKERLETFARQTNELQQQITEWSPPHAHPARVQLTNASYDRGGAYHEPLRPRSSSGSDYMRSPSTDYPYRGEPGPLYYENQVTPRPRLAYPGNQCDPLSLIPVANETTPRRIGFPPQEAMIRHTTPPVALARNPHFPPNSTHPPLLTRQQGHQPSRPQFSPVSYVHEHLHSESKSGHQT